MIGITVRNKDTGSFSFVESLGSSIDPTRWISRTSRSAWADSRLGVILATRPLGAKREKERWSRDGCDKGRDSERREADA